MSDTLFFLLYTLQCVAVRELLPSITQLLQASEDDRHQYCMPHVDSQLGKESPQQETRCGQASKILVRITVLYDPYLLQLHKHPGHSQLATAGPVAVLACPYQAPCPLPSLPQPAAQHKDTYTQPSPGKHPRHITSGFVDHKFILLLLLLYYIITTIIIIISLLASTLSWEVQRNKGGTNNSKSRKP